MSHLFNTRWPYKSAFNSLSTASHISKVMRSWWPYARMTALLLVTSPIMLLTSDLALAAQ